MSQQVTLESALLHSTIGTMGASIGLFPGMSAQVFHQMVFCRRPIGTVGAGKGLLFGVRSHVIAEVGGDNGRVGTVGAGVRLEGVGLDLPASSSSFSATHLILTTTLHL